MEPKAARTAPENAPPPTEGSSMDGAATPAPPAPPVSPLDYHPYRSRPELPAALRRHLGPAWLWGAGVMAVGIVLGVVALTIRGEFRLPRYNDDTPLQGLSVLCAVIGAGWYLVARADADRRADGTLKVQMAVTSVGALVATLEMRAGDFLWLVVLLVSVAWFAAVRLQVSRQVRRTAPRKQTPPTAP